MVNQVSKDIADTKASAEAAVTKQEGWVKTYAKPLIVGFVFGVLVVLSVFGGLGKL